MDNLKGSYICVKSFRINNDVDVREGTYWEYVGSDEIFTCNLESVNNEVIKVSCLTLACNFIKLNL